MTSEVSANSLDFINNFGTSFSISNNRITNDTTRQHPKFRNSNDVVKNIQNKRRMEFLENLKRKRERILAKMRMIEVDIFKNVNLDVEKETNINADSIDDNSTIVPNINVESSMEIDCAVIPKVHKGKKPSSKYKQQKDFRKLIADKFMLSEWLVDIPEDFFENWYMLCCPKGRRTLVVASNGRTRIYTRTGYFLFQFQSFLPGGCRSPSMHNIMTKNSMLDCIFVEDEQVFYILDVIVWNGCSFYDCDTEFRFYWMHNNIGEELKTNIENITSNDIEMAECNDVSHSQTLISSIYDFRPLQYWPCTKDNIKLRANGPYPFKTKIDGILFYHKAAPYTAGITPLVCWLKVHMIPKIFDITFN